MQGHDLNSDTEIMSIARHIAKTLLPEPAVDILKSMELYRNVHGKLPNLVFPKTFNEKVVHRSLFDKSPILTQFADKFAVRDYVEDRLGPQVLPKLYCVTDNPADIPFEKLPDQFVVKPTHGCGWIEIVRDKAALDREKLLATCADWLSKDYYEVARERFYKKIPRRILIEELLDDGTGQVPPDHKFMIFHGKVEMVVSVYDRFADHHAYVCDRHWKELAVKLWPKPQRKVPYVRPKHWEALVEAAETLARGLDFVRVDFYDTPNGIYFGELTNTPGAGFLPFYPNSYDRYLGSLW